MTIIAQVSGQGAELTITDFSYTISIKLVFIWARMF